MFPKELEDEKSIENIFAFPRESVEEALKFLEVAKKDLEVAKLLLERDYYPQALFYLQQSIEKAVKAILRVLDLADIEALKKEIGHDLLVKGLKKIVHELVAKSKDVFSISKMFTGAESVKRSVEVLCILHNLCPDVYSRIDEFVETATECVSKLQELLIKKYDEDVRKLVSNIGKIVFKESKEHKEVISKRLDEISTYLVNIVEGIKKFGIEDIVVKYWRFEESFRNCLKSLEKHVKRREELMKMLKRLDIASNEFVN